MHAIISTSIFEASHDKVCKFCNSSFSFESPLRSEGHLGRCVCYTFLLSVEPIETQL